MRKGIIMTLVFCLLSAYLGAFTVSAETDEFSSQKVMKLWYDEEAPYGNEDKNDFSWGQTVLDDGWERWSMPLGNGYMGVNVFGRTASERLQITENSMFDVRANGDGGLTNFADVYFDFNHTNSQVSNYYRDLVLDDGVAHVQYDFDGSTYYREIFADYPDKVTVMKLTSNNSGKVSFTLRPTIPNLEAFHTDSGVLRGRTGTVNANGDTITMQGVYGGYQIKYASQIKVIPTGGQMSAANDANNDHGTITVTGADSAIVIIAVGTNYKLDSSVFTISDNATKLANNPSPLPDVAQTISNASAKTYDQLLTNHKTDYQRLFGRVKVDWGGSYSNITTDVLLNNYISGTYNMYLEQLYFQFGRYLLICSSRKGTLPPNLQGIWNKYESAPWSGGYWHNINIQMNYWPVFSTNLSELFDCYVDYYKAYLPKAEALAKSHTSSAHPGNDSLSTSSGWSISTGAYPYSIGVPNGKGTDGYGTGALMAKSFYEYYAFTQDQTLLRDTLYPAVLGAATFMTKIVDPVGDKLLATPSASPEQMVDGSYYSTVGSAWDQENAYEMHKDAILMADELGYGSDPFIQTLKDRMAKLDPIKIGYSGQVKEFREEKYYGEIGEYNHRHISQLVGLFPGTLINDTTPAWLDAAKITLTKRGDQSTGWAMAHRLNLWTRTKDGNRAYDLYQQLLRTGTNTNLWDTHPPFQIDGNFGGTSGVAEMLLQSHEGYIEPIPAIPDEWSTGSYSGLLARGNFEVSAKWANAQMSKIRIKSNSGGECKVKYHNLASAVVKTVGGATVPFTSDGTDLITFNTTSGESYIISSIPVFTKTAAPTSLKATLSNIKNVALTWNASTGAASYNVYKAIEDSPSYTLLTNTTSTSYNYTASEEEKGLRTTYKVTALSSAGVESDGSIYSQVPVDLSAPDSVIAKVIGDKTQLSITPVDGASGYKIYQKTATGYDDVAYSKYTVAVVNSADKTKTYGVSAVMDKWESPKTDSVWATNAGILTENVFLNKSITSTASVIGSFPLSNALDGSLSTRYAVGDSANAYSVTIDNAGTYLLDKLKIYEFKPDEGGTRSGQTTIEVYDGSSWTTVVNAQPLNTITANGQYTEFAMNNAVASKVRITFKNTTGNAKSATIWELQCSGTEITVPAQIPNILTTSTITASRTPIASNPLGLLIDGNYTTRMAIGDTDSCQGVFNTTFDLNGKYKLGELKIYEWGGATRSPSTSVEAYTDSGWVTLQSGVSLTASYDGSKYTTFDMKNAVATKIRINYNNTITDTANSNYHKSASVLEVVCGGSVYTEPNNILKESNVTCTASTLTNMDASKCVDDNLSTRLAIGDGASSGGTYSLTFDIGSDAFLDQMRIYEFMPGEGGTRSDQTTVEVYNGTDWVKVIDAQPLNTITAQGQYTTFNLGLAKGSKIKVTFKNTDSTMYNASIWEVKCSSVSFAGNTDKTALASALTLSTAVDKTKLTTEQKTAFESAVAAAETVLANEKASQSDIDSKASALNTLCTTYGAVMPQAPVANNVSISGTVAEYETVTATYAYSDANSDPEDTASTKYIWESSNNGTDGWTAIPGATAKTFEIPNSLIGKFIRCGVKVYSTVEPKIGEYTYSPASAAVTISPNYASFTYKSLVLEHTKSVYAIGSANSQIHVTGLSDRGGYYDMTSNNKITYSSSNPEVAYADDGTGILHIGKKGSAIITATLTNSDNTEAVGSTVILVYEGAISQNNFESTNYNPTVDTHVKAVTDIVNTGTHALMISKYPTGSTSTIGKWGGLDIYRSCPYTANIAAQGWFYDNGTTSNATAYIYFQSHDKDETGTVVLPATGLYNVGLNTGSSQNYYWVQSNASNRTQAKTGTTYTGAGSVNYVLDGNNNYAAIKRTKGWHQVTYISTGNSADRFTDKGKISIYIDGVLAFTENYVHPTTNVVRAIGSIDLPVGSYYDDLALVEYAPVKTVSATFANGSVTANGTNLVSDVASEINTATGLKLQITPDEGYAIRQIKINGKIYPTSDNINLSDIPDGTSIEVSFVQANTPIAPSLTGASNVYGADGFNYVDGSGNAQHQDGGYIVSYISLDKGYKYSLNRVGVKLYDPNNPSSVANPIILDVANDIGSSWDGKYAIRVFGDAFTEGNQYVLVPFIQSKNDDTNDEDEISPENEDDFRIRFGRSYS